MMRNLDIKDFLKKWNNKHPYDRIWRKKYNIPFGSPQHLQASHMCMLIDLAEDMMDKEKYDRDKMYDDMEEQKLYDSLLPEEIQKAKDEDQIKIVRLSDEEIDAEFDKLDVTQFNDIKQ